jgi:hypothetical protein
MPNKIHEQFRNASLFWETALLMMKLTCRNTSSRCAIGTDRTSNEEWCLLGCYAVKTSNLTELQMCNKCSFLCLRGAPHSGCHRGIQSRGTGGQLSVVYSYIIEASCHAPWLKGRPLMADKITKNKSSRTLTKVIIRLTVSRPVSPGIRPPTGTWDKNFSSMEILWRHLLLFYYGAPSLTRRRVCNFQCIHSSVRAS